jgi:hypothetical protein
VIAKPDGLREGLETERLLDAGNVEGPGDRAGAEKEQVPTHQQVHPVVARELQLAPVDVDRDGGAAHHAGPVQQAVQ